jgi:hypothetical protein
MSEWWTYRPHDLLMYSARAYYGLFALENSSIWPLQLMAIAIGAAAIEWLWRGRARDQRIAIAIIAVAWCSVAWVYFVNEYSTIHTMARGFAIAFVAQALLLAIAAGRLPPSDARSRTGAVLALIALAGIPLVAPLTGRPWTQAEIFALAPDPTVGVTFGVLLLAPRSRWWLWPIPLVWTLYNGATLWMLHAYAGLALGTIAVVALLTRIVDRNSVGAVSVPSA